MFHSFVGFTSDERHHRADELGHGSRNGQRRSADQHHPDAARPREHADLCQEVGKDRLLELLLQKLHASSHQ